MRHTLVHLPIHRQGICQAFGQWKLHQPTGTLTGMAPCRCHDFTGFVFEVDTVSGFYNMADATCLRPRYLQSCELSRAFSAETSSDDPQMLFQDVSCLLIHLGLWYWEYGLLIGYGFALVYAVQIQEVSELIAPFGSFWAFLIHAVISCHLLSSPFCFLHLSALIRQGLFLLGGFVSGSQLPSSSFRLTSAVLV